MKTKLLTAGFLLAASASPITQANFLGIGWDPTGGNNPTIDLASLDWAPTSFSAKGGNAAILNAALNQQFGLSLSTDFAVYTHARLGSIVSYDEFGDPVTYTPSGLNTPITGYEYTMVMSYIESVDTVNTAGLGSATFIANLSRVSESFFEIYYGSVNANDLTGSGFRDGKLVMTGIVDDTAEAAAGSFIITNANSENLDQFGSGSAANKNNYGIQQTKKGNGTNGAVTIKITGQDTNFFKTPIDILQIANISQALPFISVNPSDCYTDSAVGVAIGSTVADTECNAVHINGQALNPATQPLPTTYHGFVPNSGPNNTTLNGADANNDFIAQTDYNSPLTPKQIPEPSSVLLLGVSLLGLLGFSSRKKMG
jgi:hypothetical protein